MEEELFSREVILANGAKVAMADATSIVNLLERFVNGEAREREFLSRLRAAALTDRVVPEGPRQALADMGLLTADGKADPTVRQVVLAAVRGEDDGLYVSSPFTNAWDRAVADLIISRSKVRAVLPADQAEWLIGSPDRGEANTAGELKKWAERVKRPRGLEDLPPPSLN